MTQPGKRTAYDGIARRYALGSDRVGGGAHFVDVMYFSSGHIMRVYETGKLVQAGFLFENALWVHSTTVLLYNFSISTPEFLVLLQISACLAASFLIYLVPGA